MTARVLAGKDAADQIRAATRERVDASGLRPVLAVVTATDDDASAWYVRSIVRAADKVGVTCRIDDVGAHATPEDIADRLRALSADPSVSGVMLQTPLPDGADAAVLAGSIDPGKDVDGANPVSLGRLAVGLPAFAPATAEAVIVLLDEYGIDVAGRHVVVVGRSAVVGKPLAHLLLNRDATVSVCHSRTTDLRTVTSVGDVVIAAAGRAHLITPEHVREGAVVVDVGTNPTADGGLTGDVDPAVADVAGALTPVPGGVGPVTTAVLLSTVAMVLLGP